MKKFRASYDCDGVTLNFWEYACKLYQKPMFSENWETPWVSQNWKDIASNEVLWQNLPPMCNPINIANSEFTEATCYITSLPPGMLDCRKTNLIEHGFPDLPIHVTYGISKYDAIIASGVDYHIDDKPSECRQLADKGVKIIQFVPWYANYKEYRKGNEDIPCITHIGELDRLISMLENVPLIVNSKNIEEWL